MKGLNHFVFATRVWIGSVLLAPVLICLLPVDGGITLGTFNVPEILYTILFIILYGFIFSIPTWIFFVLTTMGINKSKIDIQSKKVLIAIASILLNFVTFKIPFQEDLQEYWIFPVCYQFALFLGIIYFELRPPQEVFQKEIRIKTLEDILDDENY